jgi:hypothetical protein
METPWASAANKVQRISRAVGPLATCDADDWMSLNVGGFRHVWTRGMLGKQANCDRVK